MASRAPMAETLFGTPVAAGLVVGPAVLGGNRRRVVPHRYLDETAVAGERARFQDAVAAVAANLERLRTAVAAELPGEYGAIVEAHCRILADEALRNRVFRVIDRQGVNAEWAVEQALGQLAEIFNNLADPYLRERWRDLEQVGQRLLAALAGDDSGAPPPVTPGAVLVAVDTTPEEIVAAQRAGVAGMVLERGGATSHLAILVRAFDIPAVFGVTGAVTAVADGDLVVLDGNAGRVVVRPTASQEAAARQEQERRRQADDAVAAQAQLSAETTDGLAITVSANIEFVEECAGVFGRGGTGIGLFRSEYAYLGSTSQPAEEELYRTYRTLVETMRPFPVTVRTFDFGGDKVGGDMAVGKEKNPALGLRALRLSLARPQLFEVQLRALLRAAAHGPLRVALPMLTSLAELEEVQARLRAAADDLAGRGIPAARELELGVMVEVPSTVALADVLARRVDFFSIGTNDLVQYTLAVDRANALVAELYEPLHPAVLRLIHQVVAPAHRAGIPVAVCGEMAGDPLLVPVLIGLEVDELSMTPAAIPMVKRVIRASDGRALNRLARDLLGLSSDAAVRQTLADFLARQYPNILDPARLLGRRPRPVAA